MIELACHSANFHDLSLNDALGTIARLGFRSADIATYHHLPLTDFVNRRKVVEVTDLLTLFRLNVSDFVVMLPDLLAEDTYKQQHAADSFKGILPFVKVIGAQSISLVLPRTEHEISQQTVVKIIQTLVRHTQQAEIPFSIVPTIETPIDSLDSVQSILETLPQLDLTLDWGHLVYRGAKQDDIISLLPRTRHITLHQAKPYSLQTRLETGDIDVTQVLAILQDAEYSGTVSVRVLPYAERHHIEAIDAVKGSLALRDALRNARSA